MKPEELRRYSRHILLSEVGESGQEKISRSSVLVIGAGGLGCPVLQYLTAAGVGKIGIIDDDDVDESNLQRQVLFGVSSLGKNKAIAAKERLEDLNPLIEIQVYPERLTTENAIELFSEYDLVVDGTDNFATRYLVNDACVLTDTPLVYGSIYRFEGQVSVFNYKDGPTYRCLFPDPPKPGSVPNCAQVGVLGVLPGLIGTHQANEALKIILGIGDILSGKLLMLDAKTSNTSILTIQRNESQVDRVVNKQDEFLTTDYEFWCNGSVDEKEIKEISAGELAERISKDELQIIDVREPHELPKFEELKADNFPLAKIGDHAHKINRDKPVIIYCQRGGRSITAIKKLKEEYGFNNLINLTGGITTWKNKEHEYNN